MSLPRNRKLIGYTRYGNYKLVRITDKGKFTTTTDKGRARLTWREYKKAEKWAAGRKMTGLKRINKKDKMAWRYPHLEKGSTNWPKDGKLLDKMNKAAKAAKRRVRIISGYRTLAQQRYLYNLWKAGKGNLAAYPNANAPHIRGVAADCGTVNKYGTYRSAFHDSAYKRECERRGVFAWVPGEAWHLQRRETY